MSDQIKSEDFWNVYIIETECGKLYTGVATDIDRRFEEHKSSKKGAKFFRSARPKKIVYRLEGLERSLALRFEIKIKGLTRPQKLALISSGRPLSLTQAPPNDLINHVFATTYSLHLCAGIRALPSL